MKLNIKKLNENAIIPKYAHNGDAGMDLVATSMKFKNGFLEYGTGLAMEIPKGYVGLIFPRSSISKTDLTLANCVGVIDSTYRGEICFRFKGAMRMIDLKDKKSEIEKEIYYEVGDRVGQIIIMPYPEVEFNEVKDLDDTERGEGGFGSSGQ